MAVNNNKKKDQTCSSEELGEERKGGKEGEKREEVFQNEKTTLNNKQCYDRPLTKKNKNKSIKMGKTGKILCWNKGNSTFLAKKPELEILIEEHKPLLLGVLEANMGENCFSPALEIEGYNLERDNLATEGGLTRKALYVNRGLNYSRRLDLEVKAMPPIWIEVNPDTPSAWLVFVAYREWVSLAAEDKKKSRSMEQQLYRMEQWRTNWKKANSEQKPMFMIGDWNIDVTPWSSSSQVLTPYQTLKAPLLAVLQEMATENSLNLFNTPPTRRQGNDQPTIIDLLFSNRPNQVQSVNLLPSSSDHSVLSIVKVNKIQLKTPGPKIMRSFKLYSRDKMIEALNVPMLQSLLNLTDTNLVTNIFVTHITEALNTVAPIKLIQHRIRYAPYLTEKTKEQMGVRDELKLVANKSRKEDDIRTFKKFKNKTLKNQRADKIAWAKDLLGPVINDGKKVWKTVKKISNSKNNNSIDKLLINGRAVEGNGQMAEELNSFFVNKVKKLIKDMPPQHSDLCEELKTMDPVNVPQMDLLQLTMPQLVLLMKRVKCTPAAGIDGISGQILHDIFDVICHPLLHLINLSLCSGIYPELLKLTKIIPVKKDGKDPILASSYRPVCNLSVIGKLIECAVINQIENHIAKNQLINKDQHGGREKHSTMTCLGEIIEDARNALEDKKMVALVAVDLSAAFDLCDHNILIQKCRLLNICPGTLKFLESFLENRSQIVEIKGFKSKILATGGQGVVQSGPSSGTLFNIYTNTLPAQVNNQKLATSTAQSTCKGFVDDGTIVARGSNLHELKVNIQSDFEAIRKYLVNLKMVINTEKTQMMVLKPHHLTENFHVELNGEIIQSQKQIKILGLTISDDLKFDDYIWRGKNSLIRRIQYRSSMVRTLKFFLPSKIVHQVGNALINSTIQYGAALWGATSESNLNKVQTAQTRAARLMTGRCRSATNIIHRQEMFTTIKWLNVRQLVQTTTLNLVKNAISKNSSVGFNSMFKISNPLVKLRNQGIRLDHRGIPDRSRLNFSANAVYFFNLLPPDLREKKLTPNHFKAKIKEHILSNNHLPHHHICS